MAVSPLTTLLLRWFSKTHVTLACSLYAQETHHVFPCRVPSCVFPVTKRKSRGSSRPGTPILSGSCVRHTLELLVSLPQMTTAALSPTADSFSSSRSFLKWQLLREFFLIPLCAMAYLLPCDSCVRMRACVCSQMWGQRLNESATPQVPSTFFLEESLTS